MNFLKTFAAASAIALASFSASAVEMTSGGITWDPDYFQVFPSQEDFFATGDYQQSYFDGVTHAVIDDVADLTSGDYVQGAGTVLTLNGYDSDEYCAVSGCVQLWFAYSDFIYNGSEFEGGKLQFFVDYTDSISSFADVLAGDLWLDLVSSDSDLHTDDDEIAAYFDVQETVGTAWSNFDTNMIDGADIGVESSSQLGFSNSGVLSFVGNSIPEPTTLAIFGLGLLGLARMRKA